MLINSWSFFIWQYHGDYYTTLFELVASQVEKEGKRYVVDTVGSHSGYIPFTAYSAKQSYIQKNPDII